MSFLSRNLKTVVLTSSLALVAAAVCTLPLTRVHAAPADLASIGTSAPNFTLPNQENQPISLADYKGKWVVLYFYPKDQTSGCSLEAHNFQRDIDKYHALNAVVLGVSMDTVESHKTWCTKDGFSFKMLADPNHKVVDLYGVPVKTFNTANGPITIAMRNTFLISPDGKIAKEWEVKDIQNHSTEVLAAIQALAQTYKTLISGIIYEKPPDAPLPRELYAALIALISEVKKQQAERPGAPALKDMDLFYLWVFLYRMGLLRTNGRPRSRRFIAFLRSQFPQSPELKREESRIIVP